MAKQETKTKVPPKFTSVPSSGFIGSGSNQMTLSDATVKKIFKLAAVRAAAKKRSTASSMFMITVGYLPN